MFSDHHLDAYLMDPASVAYKAAHGQALAFGGNIGDVTSMIPIPYLNRAASYSAGSASHHGYDNTTDLKVSVTCSGAGFCQNSIGLSGISV